MEPKPSKEAFPLRQAYPFAEQHGLAEARGIREMEISSNRPSTVRRGFMIDLFKKHAVLAAFEREHWPHGMTKSGKTKEQWYLKIKSDFEGAKQQRGDLQELPARTPESDAVLQLDENVTGGTAFERLFAARQNSDGLYKAYNAVLEDLFRNEFWESGETVRRRILWNKGREAKATDTVAFGSPGIYIWGVEDCPLYLGMTENSFSRRFSRYIWNRWSQCNLAQEYKTELIANGIDGFPEEIKDWCRKKFRSNVRLTGAVRFAQHGIEKIWFALFPHSGLEEIRILEKALIPIVRRWNQKHCLRPPLNKRA